MVGTAKPLQDKQIISIRMYKYLRVITSRGHGSRLGAPGCIFRAAGVFRGHARADQKMAEARSVRCDISE